MIVTGTLVLAVVINFWILIAMIPLGVICIYLRQYFQKTSNDLKRLDGICTNILFFFGRPIKYNWKIKLDRSPVLIHSSNTLVGITQIRASNNYEVFQRIFEQHVNFNTKTLFAYSCIQRWYQLRLDLIAAVYSTVAIFGSILGRGT